MKPNNRDRALTMLLAAIIMTASYMAGRLFGNWMWPVQHPTSTAKYGAIVRLVLDGSTFCTGTVIGATTILTAAHCVMVDTGFSGPELRENIEIRPSNNAKVNVTANIYNVRHQMDQAILKGDFRQFNARKYISDPEKLTILRDKSKLTACGYPLGGDFFCNTIYYKSPDNFFWKVRGVLIPGMSGGPVFDENGNVVATNVAVMNEYSIVSPTYDLYLDINKGDR